MNANELQPSEHRAGFVNIIGNPNVGKSTLLNALVGERLAIITPKAQTTRHRIFGIVTEKEYQIVFSDTPGLLKPQYLLHEAMMKQVSIALSDADIILFVTEAGEKPTEEHEGFQRVRNAQVPVFLVINKVDLIQPQAVAPLTQAWQKLLPNATIFDVSALYRAHLDPLFLAILKALPVHPPYYPEDELTDKPERFFVTEMVREQVFFHYQKEIPYSVEVVAEEFLEEDQLIRISVVLYVERDSQKAILIGHRGEALKWVGTEARKKMEDFFGKKVFLNMFVKVSKDWRKTQRALKSFGYGFEEK